MSDQPFDPGLQPERVALSWQRTSLSIAAGSLIYGRLVAPTMGGWALVPVFGGLLVSLFIGARSRTRYRHHHRTLTSSRGDIADGALLALLALFVAGAGTFALLLLVIARS